MSAPPMALVLPVWTNLQVARFGAPARSGDPVTLHRSRRQSTANDVCLYSPEENPIRRRAASCASIRRPGGSISVFPGEAVPMNPSMHPVLLSLVTRFLFRRAIAQAAHYLKYALISRTGWCGPLR